METMVERVAMAIYVKAGAHEVYPSTEADWLKSPEDPSLDTYREQARAAIEAMRDLPEAIVDAVEKDHDVDCWEQETNRAIVTHVWRLSIDAALSESMKEK